MKNRETRRVYSPYRIQQLAVQAAIDSSDFDTASELAMMNINEFLQHKPREHARTGTIRNKPEQKDLAYQIGKAIARIMRRVLK